jgi:hypothetical protein
VDSFGYKNINLDIEFGLSKSREPLLAYVSSFSPLTLISDCSLTSQPQTQRTTSNIPVSTTICTIVLFDGGRSNWPSSVLLPPQARSYLAAAQPPPPPPPADAPGKVTNPSAGVYPTNTPAPASALAPAMTPVPVTPPILEAASPSISNVSPSTSNSSRRHHS